MSVHNLIGVLYVIFRLELLKFVSRESKCINFNTRKYQWKSLEIATWRFLGARSDESNCTKLKSIVSSTSTSNLNTTNVETVKPFFFVVIRLKSFRVNDKISRAPLQSSRIRRLHKKNDFFFAFPFQISNGRRTKVLNFVIALNTCLFWKKMVMVMHIIKWIG